MDSSAFNSLGPALDSLIRWSIVGMVLTVLILAGLLVFTLSFGIYEVVQHFH